MSFDQAIRVCFKKYADFNGRASRSEYWWFNLFALIIMFGSSFIFSFLGALFGTASVTSNLDSELEFLANLGFFIAIAIFFIPLLSVAVRRLHDTNKSGWYILFQLIPCVGPIILLIFLVQESSRGKNKYGYLKKK